jgi:hypothetical protein
MKQVLLLLCLSVILMGCDSEKSVVFNMSYDDVYTKTIQFIAQKGWTISYQDKEAKTIMAVLYSTTTHSGGGYTNQYGSSNNYGSSHQVSDTLSFIFNVDSDKTTVLIKASVNENIGLWNPSATFEEYTDYINKPKI